MSVLARARYGLLDRMLERGLLPDRVLRTGSVIGARSRLRREQRGGVEEQERRLGELVERMRSGPVAESVVAANEQHYELPAEFFELFLGPRLLWGDLMPTAGRVEAADPYAPEWVRSCLVRALFRQLVATGHVEDPLGDACNALRVDPARADMVGHIDALPEPERAALAAALRTHAEHLANLTPRFAAGWLPRTGDRVAIPLAGGRVVLCGMFDLLVGAPEPGRATLCALGLTTGGRWAQARTALHYLALLETLRSGTPPFRLALLHSAIGRYGVEDVLEEHLRTVVSHVAIRLSTLGHGEV